MAGAKESGRGRRKRRRQSAPPSKRCGGASRSALFAVPPALVRAEAFQADQVPCRSWPLRAADDDMPGDANKQRSVPGEEWQADADAGRAVQEYLATLDDAAFGAETTPKFISPSDPAAQSIGAHKGHAFFAYATNYLNRQRDHPVQSGRPRRSRHRPPIGRRRWRWREMWRHDAMRSSGAATSDAARGERRGRRRRNFRALIPISLRTSSPSLSSAATVPVPANAAALGGG